MRIVSITLFFSLLCPPLFGDSQPVGRHIGYLIGEYFSDSAISLDAIITGIRHYQKDAAPPLDEQTFRTLYHEMILEKIHKDEAQRLKLSENFLKSIKTEAGVVEIIPDKLYIKCLSTNDEGQLLGDQGLFHLACETMQGDLLLDTRAEGSPIMQELKHAIPGFALGVKGMREKERRLLFIHPTLAYGDCSLSDSQSALKIYVEYVSESLHRF